MANKVITMLRIRRMLQLLEKGLSLRKISKELEMGRNTISDYHARIGHSGKSYQELLSLSDNSLSKILLPVKDEIIEECIKNYDELCLEDYKKYKISLIDTTSLKWNDDEIMKLTNYAKNPLFFINAYEETLSKEILNGNKRILTHRAGFVD